MAEYLLTVAEAAELLKIGERAVRKNALAGKYGQIGYIEGSRYGRGGKEIRIPLSALPVAAQSAYMKKHKLIDEPARVAANAYDAAPQWQRDIANRRYKIIKECEAYTARPGKKVELTAGFIAAWNDAHPGEKISKSTLYNWQRRHARDGLAGLLTGYGKTKGRRAIDAAPEAWRDFCELYMQPTRPSVKDCYDILQLMAAQKGYQAPSFATIGRMAKYDLSEEAKALARHGEKYYKDNYQTFIRRDPDSIASGEVFVGDHHVLDLFIWAVKNGKGGWVRPWLTAWLDMRSRKFVGWKVSLSPCTDTIIASFAEAALHPAIGLPRKIYIDNGQDYCAHKFAGRGYRGKKLTAADKLALIEEGKRTASLMDRLEIETHHAIVENARAKVIERAFKIVVEHFSKRFPTYCGRKPEERPGDLDAKLKRPDVYGVTLEEFGRQLSDWILNDYNKRVSQGKGREGECPDQTFMRTRLPVRTADKEVLRLFFMKSTNPFKIGRNGVAFRGCEYYSAESVLFKRGQSVYIRYRDEDLSEIWLYNTKDEYVGKARLKETVAALNADPAALASAMAEQAAERKAVLNHPAVQAGKNATPRTVADLTELRKLYGHSAPDVAATKVVEVISLPCAGKDAVREMKATGTDSGRLLEALARTRIEKRGGNF